jgi:hypothetical protein
MILPCNLLITNKEEIYFCSQIKLYISRALRWLGSIDKTILHASSALSSCLLLK